ncbi:hypothetical protein QAD02_003642 [Eretmocerus hayati]|uniref:Uncharacterized protein n=1 Tax=Eretmocerus hayati TaxID=131215 RepID=A0ACC2NME4_9HYME|nr:hypothetical protein QAD02_003642 [Eretmocerus hayati]
MFGASATTSLDDMDSCVSMETARNRLLLCNRCLGFDTASTFTKDMTISLGMLIISRVRLGLSARWLRQMKALGCDLVCSSSQSRVFDGHPPKFLRPQGDQQIISHVDPNNNKGENDMSTFNRSPSTEYQAGGAAEAVPSACLQRHQQLRGATGPRNTSIYPVASYRTHFYGVN